MATDTPRTEAVSLRDALNDAFDLVMEGIEDRTVRRETGDRILEALARARWSPEYAALAKADADR